MIVELIIKQPNEEEMKEPLSCLCKKTYGEATGGFESKKDFLDWCEKVYDAAQFRFKIYDMSDGYNEEKFKEFYESLTAEDKVKLLKTFDELGGFEALFNDDKEAE